MYVWHLDKDLTGSGSDSVFSIIPCLQQVYYYKVSGIISNSNTTDLIVSADKINGKSTDTFEAVYDKVGAAGISETGSGLYNNRDLSMILDKDLNGNGYHTYSNVPKDPILYNNVLRNDYGSSPAIKTHIKTDPQKPTFAIFNFDAQNNLKWSRCFNDSTNGDIESLLNEAVYIHTTSGLHLIYTKLATSKRQTLYDMTFDNDGNYMVRPIISMNIKYTYYPNLGIQLDENSLLMPCVKNGKTALSKYIIK